MQFPAVYVELTILTMKNKLCCRIFPVVAILIAAIINVGIRYFEDGASYLGFLSKKDEFFSFLGTTLVCAFLPIGLFYYLSDSEKYQGKARVLAMLGFIPALIWLVLVR